MAVPKVGDEIYVDDCGWEGTNGGLAKVSRIEENGGVHFVSMEEVGVSFRWEEHLEDLQGQLRERFGSIRASSE